MNYPEAAQIFEKVTLISHADWSKFRAKRWMAIACLQSDQRWLITESAEVSDLPGFFSKLKSAQRMPGCILSGFDFPIGLPNDYAMKSGITDFLSTLPLFGHGEWDQFYNPAELPSEISLHRPFYPMRPGGSERKYLESGLDLSFSQLHRLCETGHENRGVACSLFWTMGAQQVGKAAISGWRDLLVPALGDEKLNLKIWPFSGRLAELCQPENIVVVETYPAEYYHHLGLSFSTPARKSKRNPSDRRSFSSHLISWARDHQLDMDEQVLCQVKDGFGAGDTGEDPFDALVGLYGMINVVLGNHTIGESGSDRVNKIEGWIFGQEYRER